MKSSSIWMSAMLFSVRPSGGLWLIRCTTHGPMFIVCKSICLNAKCHLELRLSGYHKQDYWTCCWKGYHSAWFAANPTKFVFNQQTHKWTPRKQDFAIGHICILCLSQGQWFRTLLPSSSSHCSQGCHFLWGSSHGQWSAQANLQRHMYCIGPSFRWYQCLEEAGLIATEHQLRVLFVTILYECSLSDPRHLWDTHKHRLCDDLRYRLQHRHIRENPSEDPSDKDIWDYGLFLIDWLLSNFNKSLRDWPDMPQV